MATDKLEEVLQLFFGIIFAVFIAAFFVKMLWQMWRDS